MTDTVLILGATGRFGKHAAEAFWNAGWHVRLFDRSADDLMQMAQGADVIVNAWNPPYTDWATQVPVMTKLVIEAAKVSGATVIIPGNVYGYGKGAPPVIEPDTPKRARNSLGRIRNDMEAAYAASDVPTIVLRAGDFIDTQASGNWFDEVITAKLSKGKIVSPGTPGAPHAWAYLPDLARAATALAVTRETLARFQEVLYPGFTLSLQQITELAEQATGRDLKTHQMSWAPLWIASPFWKTGRHLLEMRYLWSMPHRLDRAQMMHLLPKFRETDPLTAIASALGQKDIQPDQPMPRRAHHVAAE